MVGEKIQSPGRTSDRRDASAQRGVALVVVLVCLALAGLLFLLVVRQAAMERKVARMAQLRLQAVWLVEAGLERAAARLAEDAKYTGENWAISPKELGADDGAVVKIVVEKVADRPGRRAVHAEAVCSEGSMALVRHTKQLYVDGVAVETVGREQKKKQKTPSKGEK